MDDYFKTQSNRFILFFTLFFEDSGGLMDKCKINPYKIWQADIF